MNPPPVAPPCLCGHSRFVHYSSTTVKDADGLPLRTYCSSWYGGKCRCRAYSPQRTDDAHAERPAP